MTTLFTVLGYLAASNLTLAAFSLYLARKDKQAAKASIQESAAGFAICVDGKTTGNFATWQDAAKVARLNGYETH